MSPGPLRFPTCGPIGAINCSPRAAPHTVAQPLSRWLQTDSTVIKSFKESAVADISVRSCELRPRHYIKSSRYSTAPRCQRSLLDVLLGFSLKGAVMEYPCPQLICWRKESLEHGSTVSDFPEVEYLGWCAFIFLFFCSVFLIGWQFGVSLWSRLNYLNNGCYAKCTNVHG